MNSDKKAGNHYVLIYESNTSIMIGFSYQQQKRLTFPCVYSTFSNKNTSIVTVIKQRKTKQNKHQSKTVDKMSVRGKPIVNAGPLYDVLRTRSKIQLSLMAFPFDREVI